MVTNLTRHGEGYALVIDEALLEQIRATPDTSFEVISDGCSLVLTPIRSPQEQEKFDRAVEDVHHRFAGAMKKLAE